jgi:D-alanyl-lipoteichoic acid acyltransferase DltB (MBOAT superfamily)
LDLINILILILASLLLAILGRGRLRIPLLLVSSILVIYWLQPPTPIRHLDFWLPTITLALTIFVWAVTRAPESPSLRDNLPYFFIIGGAVIIIDLFRYLDPVCCLTPTRPPDLLNVLFVLLVTCAFSLLVARYLPGKAVLINILTWLILGLFVILKTEFLGFLTSSGLRSLTGQSTNLASALDLRWLGFSYVAFRLIHTLRDRIAGRLPGYSLAEFAIYIIFFPSFTAGPIDRIQRFAQDLRKPFQLQISTLLYGGKRLVIGIFNKFVLADALAIIALNDANASQTSSTGWLWVLLYAYAFRIYFDFAGYTDIAIGLGSLLGIQLPENFARPYLKPNLTQFWNSWHITLAQWFRAYYFNPLTRSLRSNPRQIPMPLIIFVGQASTMLLIGLWHGITWNFAIWGLWHGMGLFIHNRWTEFTRPRLASLEDKPRQKKALELGGIFLTFNYVALGWVWFSLNFPSQAWQVFLQLFGITG